MFGGRNILGVNLKAVGVPVLFLAVLVVLIVIVVNTGFKRAMELRSSLMESERQIEVLSNKLETLEAGQTSYETFSDLSAVAIPEKNPATIVTSQVKTLAQTRGVIITKVSSRTQGSPDSDISELGVELNAEGELASMLDYFDSLNSFLPLTLIDSLSLSSQDTFIQIDARIVSFFAPFPKTLPSLTSPIQDLTEEEKLLLGDFALFSQPTFTYSQVTPGGPYQRANLFSF